VTHIYLTPWLKGKSLNNCQVTPLPDLSSLIEKCAIVAGEVDSFSGMESRNFPRARCLDFKKLTSQDRLSLFGAQVGLRCTGRKSIGLLTLLNYYAA